MSYMILSPPAKKNGKFIRTGLARNMTPSEGEIEAPIERAIEVIPDAADLSSLLTAIIVYVCRVGTSICEMLNLKRSIAIAVVRFGISGTKRSKIFDGRCVKTIVFIRPSLPAILIAYKDERPAIKFAAKKILPIDPVFTLNLR